MGIFSGIKDAQVTGGGVYFLPGLYPEVEVEACKLINTRKDDEMFIVECKIVESDVPERAPGTHASFTANLTKHDAALGNIKQFAAAGLDCALSEINEAVMEEIVGEGNPLAGVRLKLECANIKTRAGGDFTKHTFMQLDGRLPANEPGDASEYHSPAQAAPKQPPATQAGKSAAQQQQRPVTQAGKSVLPGRGVRK